MKTITAGLTSLNRELRAVWMLLFVGLKLRLAPSLQTALVLLVLLARAGLNLLLAAAVNAALGCSKHQALGWLLFLQSAASFWPYAAMQSATQRSPPGPRSSASACNATFVRPERVAR